MPDSLPDIDELTEASTSVISTERRFLIVGYFLGHPVYAIIVNEIKKKEKILKSNNFFT